MRSSTSSRTSLFVWATCSTVSVSSFSKDPARALGLKGEVTHAQAILDKIQAGRKIFIEGNHEDRLRRYLTDKAPELLPFVSIPKLLDLKAKGWEHVPYKDSIQIGKLWITHDVGYSGRYANFRALDAFQASVVTGHTHRLGYAVEGDARGNYHVSAQFGWLGDYVAVGYMHRVQARRAWAHGFGTGLFEPSTGYVYLRVHPIVDYTVEVDGVRFIRRAKKKPKVDRMYFEAGIDLHRLGATFLFLPVCGRCKKQAPACTCGRPTKRPS
jgi:hypothetical protein